MDEEFYWYEGCGARSRRIREKEGTPTPLSNERVGGCHLGVKIGSMDTGDDPGGILPLWEQLESLLPAVVDQPAWEPFFMDLGSAGAAGENSDDHFDVLPSTAEHELRLQEKGAAIPLQLTPESVMVDPTLSKHEATAPSVSPSSSAEGANTEHTDLQQRSEAAGQEGAEPPARCERTDARLQASPGEDHAPSLQHAVRGLTGPRQARAREDRRVACSTPERTDARLQARCSDRRAAARCERTAAARKHAV
ncbi:hypothetical protein CYMTET_23885 [Cymbomonas tetramitiformis]|uniref:Uncharacterized protein n=1 Tax=Cymbomonas tetramitiformis TaxID=36881 RepID=A0AAE0FXG8_9CHLO|nr:hypothetical protein CYMTET_23885 [Cymbomonas tetramitiformis]